MKKKDMPRKRRARPWSEAGPLSAVLLKISEAVHATENLGELFATIHRIVGELMPVKNFFIAFYEKGRGGGEYVTFPFFVDEYDEAPRGRLPLRKTLTGYVIRKGRAMLLTSARLRVLERRGEIEAAIGTNPQVWLGVPLHVQGAITGAVVVQSYARADEYGGREKNILGLVSEQIAIAIELARYRQNQDEVVQQRTRELEEEKRVQSILFDISQSVYGAAGLKEFLAAVHFKVGELLDARNFYVALYNRETGKYSFPYFADEYDRFDELKDEELHDSLTDYVRRKGALLADGEVHRRLIASGDVAGVVGTDSLVWLGVPLLVPGKKEAIGVMTVQSYEDKKRYTEKEMRILMSISTTVALAVDRILLVSEMIHHFNNAITGIKGNAEMLLMMIGKQNDRLRIVDERLRKYLPPAADPELVQNRDALKDIIGILADEGQIQAKHIGKVLAGIDQAAERVNRIFMPLLPGRGLPAGSSAEPNKTAVEKVKKK